MDKHMIKTLVLSIMQIRENGRSPVRVKMRKAQIEWPGCLEQWCGCGDWNPHTDAGLKC